MSAYLELEVLAFTVSGRVSRPCAEVYEADANLPALHRGLDEAAAAYGR